MDGKCGNIQRMEQTFQTVKDPDLITFTSMAKAYVVNVSERTFDRFSRSSNVILGSPVESLGDLRSSEAKLSREV